MLSFDAVLGAPNHFYWRVLYDKEFGPSAYPPPLPVDSSNPLSADSGPEAHSLDAHTPRSIAPRVSFQSPGIGWGGSRAAAAEEVPPMPLSVPPPRRRSQFLRPTTPPSDADRATPPPLGTFVAFGASLETPQGAPLQTDDASSASAASPETPTSPGPPSFSLTAPLTPRPPGPSRGAAPRIVLPHSDSPAWWSLAVAALREASWSVMMGPDQFGLSAGEPSRFAAAMKELHERQQLRSSAMEVQSFELDFISRFNAATLAEENKRRLRWGMARVRQLPRSMALTQHHLSHIRACGARLALLPKAPPAPEPVLLHRSYFSRDPGQVPLTQRVLRGTEPAPPAPSVTADNVLRHMALVANERPVSMGHEVFQRTAPFLASICDPSLVDAMVRSSRLQEGGPPPGAPAIEASVIPLFSMASTWEECYRRRKAWRFAPFLFFLVRDASLNHGHFIAAIDMIMCAGAAHTHTSGGADTANCVDTTTSRTGAGLVPVDGSGPLAGGFVPATGQQIAPECPMWRLEKLFYDITTVLEGTETSLSIQCGAVMAFLLRHYTSACLVPPRSGSRKHFSEVEFNDMFLLRDLIGRRSRFRSDTEGGADREESMAAALILAGVLEGRLAEVRAKISSGSTVQAKAVPAAGRPNRRGAASPTEVADVSAAVVAKVPSPAMTLLTVPLVLLTTYMRPYVVAWLRPVVAALADVFAAPHESSRFARAEYARLVAQGRTSSPRASAAARSPSFRTTRPASSESVQDDVDQYQRRKAAALCRTCLFYTSDQVRDDMEATCDAIEQANGRPVLPNGLVGLRDRHEEREEHIAECVQRAVEVLVERLISEERLAAFPPPVQALLSQFASQIHVHLLTSITAPAVVAECREAVRRATPGGRACDSALCERLVEAVAGPLGGSTHTGRTPLLLDVMGARIAHLVLFDALVLPALRDPVAHGLAQRREAGSRASSGKGVSRHTSDLSRTGHPPRSSLAMDPTTAPTSDCGPVTSIPVLDRHAEQNFFALAHYVQIIASAPFIHRSLKVKGLDSEISNESSTEGLIAGCFKGLPKRPCLPPLIPGLLNVDTGLMVRRRPTDLRALLRPNQSHLARMVEALNPAPPPQPETRSRRHSSIHGQSPLRRRFGGSIFGESPAAPKVRTLTLPPGQDAAVPEDSDDDEDVTTLVETLLRCEGLQPMAAVQLTFENVPSSDDALPPYLSPSLRRLNEGVGCVSFRPARTFASAAVQSSELLGPRQALAMYRAAFGRCRDWSVVNACTSPAEGLAALVLALSCKALPLPTSPPMEIYSQETRWAPYRRACPPNAAFVLVEAASSRWRRALPSKPHQLPTSAQLVQFSVEGLYRLMHPASGLSALQAPERPFAEHLKEALLCPSVVERARRHVRANNAPLADALCASATPNALSSAVDSGLPPLPELQSLMHTLAAFGSITDSTGLESLRACDPQSGAMVVPSAVLSRDAIIAGGTAPCEGRPPTHAADPPYVPPDVLWSRWYAHVVAALLQRVQRVSEECNTQHEREWREHVAKASGPRLRRVGPLAMHSGMVRDVVVDRPDATVRDSDDAFRVMSDVTQKVLRHPEVVATGKKNMKFGGGGAPAIRIALKGLEVLSPATPQTRKHSTSPRQQPKK